ncbi:peroxiredoxin [Pseudomonas amygdali pv. tabaci str. ATCC 11528]|jgi:thiol-disulfide isomerase/thioredoxin|uniref:Thioredoxin n=28 Tax=Pseudomonas TaxID=286 RepID=A0A0Q0C8L0_PSEAJ|nr:MULTISPECIES: TlpA disulfide reductase family protein [Pseudomonas syringae group]KPW50808.1 TlpA-like protein-disulfide reductase [Pseudomonas syringae pv. broussonetiae]AAO55208.1 thioredoxin, putative [Pseudomonas syringae pv. tomato str. DC3000]ARA82339.1 thioredoxin [Pseudomonas amygdali pv. lachrymans]AVB21479.1 TlpA family protein disulfide reductase [Pseudomonas avellanae]AXH57496.1 TlpA family protein disulfide reductase [Pseudomonas amygdali pv. lachrymans str. M301315]
MARRLTAAVILFGSLLLSGCGVDLGTDQNGQKVASERIKGHWLVVNYWAEWCGPCRTEVPEFNALSEQLKDKKVTVLGVNFDNLQGDELKNAANALGIKFTVLAQDPAEQYSLPPSEALPVTYIIDDKGKMREQLLGEQSAATVIQKLKALRGEG